MGRRSELTSGTGGLSLAAKRLLAIVAYYAALALAIALTWRFSASIRQLFAGTSLGDLAVGAGTGSAATITQALSDTVARAITADSILEQSRSTLVVLAGALVTSLPVAWSYSLTRRRRGFAQSMVHILVLLPVAVAGMVALIQNSLALAFSLAGIVAVLRFRNALDDVKDGVYIFISVAIGISAAMSALTVGLLTSLVFNTCVLVLWWLDFARRPTPGIRGGVWRLMRLPKVLHPREPNEQRAASNGGDGEEAFASAAREWRRQLNLSMEHRAAGPKQHVNASLRIQTATPDESRPLVEAVLRNRTRRWRLVGIVPGDGELSTLKYRVSVHRAERSELLDAVRSEAQIAGAELR
ncbi:MAG: DUF4956 domain-containing protein [Gemmatimonadaceae bacterium]